MKSDPEYKLPPRLPQKSWLYSLVKQWVKLIIPVFFKEIVVEGQENIPASCAVILAPNHQNSFLDGVVTLCFLPRPVVSLARANVFNHSIAGKILAALYMRPVFRQRDGVNTVERNKPIFDLTINDLLNGRAVLIFPEGNQDFKRQLRSLQKGFARICFGVLTKQQMPGTNIQEPQKPLVIVPVGINYTRHRWWRGRVYVVYGQPIDVGNYYQTYTELPQRGLRQITDDLAAKMQALIVHIAPTEYYEVINFLRRFYRFEQVKKLHPSKTSTLPQRHKAEQQIVNALNQYAQTQPDEMALLAQTTQLYLQQLRAIELPFYSTLQVPITIKQQMLAVVKHIILLPIYVWGLLHSGLPVFIAQTLGINLVRKEPQFQASVMFAASLLLFPLFWLLIFCLVLAIWQPVWWIAILYAISIPLSGKITIWGFEQLKRLKYQFRYAYYYRHHPDIIKRLNATCSEIYEWMRNIVP